MDEITAIQVSIAVMSAIPALSAESQSHAPIGHRGIGTEATAAAPTERDAPVLTRISDATLSGLFRVDPNYRRDTSTGQIKVVGVFEVEETKRRHLVAARSPGFLPITLAFSDGQCFSLQADYTGGTLSNGRLSKVECEDRRQADKRAPSSPPADSHLRFVGSAWGYGAWADDQAKTTLVTAPYAEAFQPLFYAQMSTSAIMAMNGPDFPGGDVTLVGRVGKRLTVVTLEVGY